MNIYDLPVHPNADVFPMLDSEDLAELAEDIRENGLRHPIVLGPSPEGEVWLVDGRNRREACYQAGIAEPETMMLNGEDQDAYIISENINRRHMTKGQRAMAVARIYPEPGNRWKSGFVTKPDDEVNKAALSKARAVLRYAPDLADAVLRADTSLDAAYEKARETKVWGESEAGRVERLAQRHTDLAAQVRGGELKIDTAEGIARDRDELERRAVQQAQDATQGVFRDCEILTESEYTLTHIENLEGVIQCLQKTADTLTLKLEQSAKKPG